jgi:hypothetical protein
LAIGQAEPGFRLLETLFQLQSLIGPRQYKRAEKHDAA